MSNTNGEASQPSKQIQNHQNFQINIQQYFIGDPASNQIIDKVAIPNINGVSINDSSFISLSSNQNQKSSQNDGAYGDAPKPTASGQK